MPDIVRAVAPRLEEINRYLDSNDPLTEEGITLQILGELTAELLTMSRSKPGE